MESTLFLFSQKNKYYLIKSFRDDDYSNLSSWSVAMKASSIEKLTKAIPQQKVFSAFSKEDKNLLFEFLEKEKLEKLVKSPSEKITKKLKM